MDDFARHWGIDTKLQARGGVAGIEASPRPAERDIWLLQRKASKPGQGLGKTTGWVHRTVLRDAGVTMLGGVEYRRIDDAGLHVEIAGEPRLIEVDHVVVCAGQEPQRGLLEPLRATGMTVHCIGGADKAVELDAKRAIKQAAELAAGI